MSPQQSMLTSVLRQQLETLYVENSNCDQIYHMNQEDLSIVKSFWVTRILIGTVYTYKQMNNLKEWQQMLGSTCAVTTSERENGQLVKAVPIKYKKLIIGNIVRLKERLPYVIDPFKTESDMWSSTIINHLEREGGIIDSLTTALFLESESKWPWFIGTLYQTLLKETRKEIVSSLVNRNHLTDGEMGASTQWFTPQWIIEYMVDNSLAHFLDDQTQSDFKKQSRCFINHEQFNEKDRKSQPNCITHINVLDPCVGTGHILLHTFQRLYELHDSLLEKSPKEIVEYIIQHQLVGLDIDARMVELSRFAILVLAKDKAPDADMTSLEQRLLTLSRPDESFKEQWQSFYRRYHNELNSSQWSALHRVVEWKEREGAFGSLTNGEACNVSHLLKLLRDCFQDVSDDNDKWVLDTKFFYLQQMQLINANYDVVVTNPPYMGKKRMPSKVRAYLNEHYVRSKGDLSAAYIERCLSFTKRYGITAIVNQHSWMFLSSFENLRKKVLRETSVCSMLHLGTRAFDEIGGEVVQTTAFLLQHHHQPSHKGVFVRLVDYPNSLEKFKHLHKKDNWYVQPMRNFFSIPNTPLAYWISENVKYIFQTYPRIEQVAKPRQGLATGDNQRFIRYWFEVDWSQIAFSCSTREEAVQSEKQWFPYNKGGGFRKWYGNQWYVVNWLNDGEDIQSFRNQHGKLRSRPQNRSYYFQPGLTWSFVSSDGPSVRYTPKGFIFDVGGSTMFPNEEDMYLLLGYLNSTVATYFLNMINPTMNVQVGNISQLPTPPWPDDTDELKRLVSTIVQSAKDYWDQFEQSWNFKEHPFMMLANEGDCLQSVIKKWEADQENERDACLANEQKNNEMMIECFQLHKECSPEVGEKDFTLWQTPTAEMVKALLSYFVGCTFGRFQPNDGSLNECSRFIGLSHPYDKVNGVITLLERWLKRSFPACDVNILLDSIASYLPTSIGKARETIIHYFQHDFYREHVRSFKKRPIYWMVNSGRTKAYQALFYSHHFDDTLKDMLIEDIKEKMKANEEGSVQQVEQESFIKNIEEWNAPRTLDFNKGIRHNAKKFWERRSVYSPSQYFDIIERF
ncbi:BREX-1 system adenine-specific DNA-methyltransferase PglX [Texcoconibacillus texcoconensis]|uniref:site-specific DNA-methyltransferase (adenine-specific) n=1 Tax=Texcoconibacillus texcoconensis TaxID=1095777 RepID=A0A840QQQ3_9BACI|nr:BREX-1 system adenine-specific DNA-methyltransferase PglX [Texcoconibacillus texcoconensis]MBB5173668.1 hypothetical protein [Texcoconibacillus texcoconensis]